MLQETPWYIDPNLYIRRDPLVIHYFTDGSINRDQYNVPKGAAGGFIRIDTDSNSSVIDIHEPHINTMMTNDINRVEARGVNMALDDIRRYTIDSDLVKIHTDSKTVVDVTRDKKVIQFAEESTQQEFDTLVKRYNSVANDRSMMIDKIKSHVGAKDQVIAYRRSNKDQHISTKEAHLFNRGNSYIDAAVNIACYQKDDE